MDLNGDSYRDILSGSYSRHGQPMAGLFQVLWGQADGTFKQAETLKGTDDEPLIIPYENDEGAPEAISDNIVDGICTRPTAVDWDADGNLDLVVGNFRGTFYLFVGEGQGKFQPEPEIINSGDSPLQIAGHHSDPFVVDWDGDGDLDVLSGSSNGGVQWAENRGAAGKAPELTPFEILIPPGPRFKQGQSLGEDDLTGPASATRVWVDDVNSDGKLDILVGDTVTLVSPADGVSEQEMRAQFAKWSKDAQAAIKAMNAADANEAERQKAQVRWRELYEARKTFIHEERTGFVWLYLRK